MAGLTTPDREPDLIRKFQCTFWGGNNNKKHSVFAPARDNIHGIYNESLQNSEYIVYRPEQQTIKWLAVVE
jgi:hypothetical protein